MKKLHLKGSQYHLERNEPLFQKLYFSPQAGRPRNEAIVFVCFIFKLQSSVLGQLANSSKWT